MSERVIQPSDVVPMFKAALPGYASLIDNSMRNFGNVTPYPMMWDLFPALIDDYRRDPGKEADLVAFFKLCEDMLLHGHTSVRDLAALQGVEPAAQPEVRDLKLERFMGPATKKELGRYLEY